MGTRSEEWRRTSRTTFFELNQNGGEGVESGIISLHSGNVTDRM
jgi:hypothetical protein